jgi:hypothetical protein
MGHRDHGDGTWFFDHEHACADCGLSIGCDGTFESDSGSTRGYCPDAPERCEDCQEAADAAEGDDDDGA